MFTPWPPPSGGTLGHPKSPRAQGELILCIHCINYTAGGQRTAVRRPVADVLGQQHLKIDLIDLHVVAADSDGHFSDLDYRLVAEVAAGLYEHADDAEAVVLGERLLHGA